MRRRKLVCPLCTSRTVSPPNFVTRESGYFWLSVAMSVRSELDCVFIYIYIYASVDSLVCQFDVFAAHSIWIQYNLQSTLALKG